MFRALLLDCDGVLLDSEPLHAATWAEVLRPLGLDLELSWFNPWIGISDELLAEHLHREHSLPPPGELLARKRLAYDTAVRAGRLPAFPGVRAALERLRAAGVPCAAVTNSRTASTRLGLETAELWGFLDALVAVDQVARGKPEPDLYLEGARRLATPPADCAALEDSPTGLQAALSAGCVAYGVLTTHRADALAKAAKLFAGPAEALAFLLAARA